MLQDLVSIQQNENYFISTWCETPQKCGNKHVHLDIILEYCSRDNSINQYDTTTNNIIIDIWMNTLSTCVRFYKPHVHEEFHTSGSWFLILSPEREAVSQAISNISSWVNMVGNLAIGSMSLPGFPSPDRKSECRWIKLMPAVSCDSTRIQICWPRHFGVAVFFLLYASLNILSIQRWPLVDLEAVFRLFVAAKEKAFLRIPVTNRWSEAELTSLWQGGKLSFVIGRMKMTLTSPDLSFNVITRISTCQILSTS